MNNDVIKNNLLGVYVLRCIYYDTRKPYDKSYNKHTEVFRNEKEKECWERMNSNFKLIKKEDI